MNETEKREAIEHISEIGQRKSIAMTLQPISLKDRLRALISVFLDDSNFDPITKKIIQNLIVNFLKNASDEDIRQSIIKLREDVLPFVMDEENCDCMTYNIRGPHHNPSCPKYESPNP